MGLSGTVLMLKTISGFGEIESTEILRPFSSQTVPHRFTSTWKVLLTSDSHFRPNRKWKYGGNQKNELAAIDFLFDFSTMYMRLSGTASTLKTTSGLVEIKTTEIRCRSVVTLTR